MPLSATTPNLFGITSAKAGVLTSAQEAINDNITYQAPANTATLIKTCSIANRGGGAALITIAVVPAGGTNDGTHTLIPQFSLAVGDTVDLTELRGAWLGAGDQLVIGNNITNAVDVVLTGIEFS